MAAGHHTRGAPLAVQERAHSPTHERSSLSSRAEAVGRELARYSLVVVAGWIGLLKFTAYEAEGIRLYVANSPLMSWVYGYLSVREFAAVLGIDRGRRRASYRRAPVFASGLLWSAASWRSGCSSRR
jgi:hypothetical protein